MFNPFNAFQSASQSVNQAAADAAKAADNADRANPAGNPFGMPNMTSGPFGPAFGAAKETMEAGMQQATSQWQEQMQAFLSPQKTFEKLFDMNAVKGMFPPELTQAWSAFMPGAVNGAANNAAGSGGGNGSNATGANPVEQMQEQMQQAGKQFTSQARQVMQAMQGAAQQAASPTGPVSGTLGSVDLSALIAAQQKNMEVLGQAQSATVGSWQQVMKRQSEIFHDTMQTAATAMNELMATGAPEEKLARQADLAKQAFETAGRNIEELAKLVGDGSREAMRVVSARVQESLDEIKAAAQKGPFSGPLATAAADRTTQAAASAMQDAANAATNAAGTAFKAATNAARDAASTVGTTGDAVQ